jgi:hypothetical protein
MRKEPPSTHHPAGSADLLGVPTAIELAATADAETSRTPTPMPTTH